MRWLASFLIIVVVLCDLQDNRSANAQPMDEGRIGFIKEALGWMTFRQNGELMTDEDVQGLFLEPVVKRYSSSKMYRAFVIAFMHGVIPRLTLKEGDTCNPNYTNKEYKNPFNNSVTWYFQKKTAFEDFKNRRSPGDRQYCDYRDGLICHPTTKKCECPDGAKMEEIDPGSPVKRCLLQADEICSLIDLDHGTDYKHSALAENLPHMIFNLEKPLSCKAGTQCRFKEDTLNYPKCYDVNSGPFIDSGFNVSLGEECAIGLYASPGTCLVFPDFPGFSYQEFRGFMCYNYGPPRSQRDNPPVPNRIGFCGPEKGQFGFGSGLGGNGEGLYRADPSMLQFVHPRTVSLRGMELENFYRKFVEEWAGDWLANARMEGEEGDHCNEDYAHRLDKIWSYYASLEDDPPPGEDYVLTATASELNAHLDELIVIRGYSGFGKSTCRPYYHYKNYNYGEPYRISEESPGLKCVKEPFRFPKFGEFPEFPDFNGDDGKCHYPSNVEATALPAHRRFRDFINLVSDGEIDLLREESLVDERILLAFPEPPCVPEDRIGAEGRSGDTVPLAPGLHGSCPDKSVCYEDLSDNRDIYDWDCTRMDNTTQYMVCHSTENKNLANCEKKYMRNRVREAISRIDDYAQLTEGANCDIRLEEIVNDFESNKKEKNLYEVLSLIERGKICKRSDKLKCESNWYYGDHCKVQEEPETEEPYYPEPPSPPYYPGEPDWGPRPRPPPAPLDPPQEYNGAESRGWTKMGFLLPFLVHLCQN